MWLYHAILPHPRCWLGWAHSPSDSNLGTGWNPSPAWVLGGLTLKKDDFRTHRARMPLRRRAGPTADASVHATNGPYLSYAIDDQLESSRPTRAGRTRSRTAIQAGNTPLRPDYHRTARSGFAAPAAPALPPKTTPRSPPLPRSDRLGSTTPLGRPGLCHPLPAQNLQINTTPPATATATGIRLNAQTPMRCHPALHTTRSPRPPPRSLCDHLLLHKRPEIADITDLAAKGRLLRGDDDTILLVRKQITTDSTPDGHDSHRRRHPFDDPVRIYVPLLVRPRIMHACHAEASCHLGVTRTLKMLERFYWWVGMEVCTKWWIRHCCLKCQARKTSRQTIRRPTLSVPLPNSPGISVSVDYFRTLPTTARGNSYVLIFTDRFSRRADTFAVTAAELTAEGTANILVNRFIPLWGRQSIFYPTTAFNSARNSQQPSTSSLVYTN